MLGAMRSRKGGVGMYIILGLLFVGLIGFGIGGFGGFAARSIGTVGETPIPVTTYVSTLNFTRNQIMQQTGQAPRYVDLRAAGTLESILDETVRGTGLEDLNRSFGISIGDERLREEITSNPQFRSTDGSFNPTSYDFFLDRNGFTRAEYETLLRRSAARSLIEQAVFSGIQVPNEAIEPIINYALEARNVAWIELSESDLETEISAPSAEDTRQFYDDNPEAFVQPETKSITYAWLTPDLLDDTAISEDALLAEYEAQSSRYSLPERRAMERLAFTDTDAARAAKARIDNGEITFLDLVTERGLELVDIDLGIITRADISPAVAETLFDNIEPGVYGPLVGQLGPALYRVTTSLAAQVIPFEEVREELERELLSLERERVLRDLVTQIEDLLAAGATIEELADETLMVQGQIDFNIESEGGIAGYGEFQDAAIAGQVDDFPELILLSDGGFFAQRVDAVRPAGTKPYESVLEDAQAAARADAVNTALNALGAALETRAEAGENFVSLGYASSQVNDLRRGVPTNDFDFLSISAIFDADDQGYAIVDQDDGIALVKILQVIPPNLEDAEVADVVGRVRREYDQELAIDLLNAFADAAADEAGVSLNFPIIDQIHNQVFPGQLGN
ncbi:MAG: SurA N-terminal domain-containing protein [Pseudomonadota bacterium]